MVAILVNAVDGLLARWISIPLAVDRLIQSRRVALLLSAVAQREYGAAGAWRDAPAAGQRTRRAASGTRKTHGRNQESFTPRVVSNGCASSAAMVGCDQGELVSSAWIEKEPAFAGKPAGSRRGAAPKPYPPLARA